MSTVTFRPDYAKFMVVCEPDRWNHLYQSFCAISHEVKFTAEFLKSHKVNRLWYNADSGMETWVIEIWGEWAGIVEKMDVHWVGRLKRFDVRAIVWDANQDTVLDLGQHLQRNINRHNINVYNTKAASKRLGRDRGGVGFAIGSHKSDLRITTYKRTGEPVAQEFQCTGAMLKRLVEKTLADVGYLSAVRSPWVYLNKLIQAEGQKRLQQVLESAGIGTYWPIVGAQDIPNVPPTQSAFIPELTDILADDDQQRHPADQD